MTLKSNISFFALLLINPTAIAHNISS